MCVTTTCNLNHAIFTLSESLKNLWCTSAQNCFAECMITEHFLQPHELRHFSSMKYAPRSLLSTHLFVRENPFPSKLHEAVRARRMHVVNKKSPFPVCTLPPEILSKAKGKKLKRETKGKEPCRIVLTITGTCIVRAMSQFDVCCWTGSSSFFRK